MTPEQAKKEIIRLFDFVAPLSRARGDCIDDLEEISEDAAARANAMREDEAAEEGDGS